MEVKPRQFRLRTFFVVVAVIAFFFSLGRGYVFGPFVPGPILKAYIVSLTTAVVFAAWRAMRIEQALGKTVFEISLGTGAVAAGCGLALGIEIAEGFRRMDYFNWHEDWHHLFWHSLVLAGAGSVLGFYTIAFVMTLRDVARR